MSKHWSDNTNLQEHFIHEGKEHREFTSYKTYNSSEFLSLCLEKMQHKRGIGRGIRLEGQKFLFDFNPSAIKRCEGGEMISVFGDNGGGDESFCMVEVILDLQKTSEKLKVRFFHHLSLPSVIEIA
jgi:hypothetical protein